MTSDLNMGHSILVFLLNKQVKYKLNRFAEVPYGKPIERSLLCDKLNIYSKVCTNLTFDLFLEWYVFNLLNCRFE